MRQPPPSVFVADDKFFDVIRSLEARGWTRHPHLSFPKFRLKWTNYSKISWTSARAAANGTQWLNHFQHAVLFSQKHVFAHALYNYDRSTTGATDAQSSGGAGAGVDRFYLRTFDLLRDDDTQLLREWFLYSSALATLKSYAVHPGAHDGAIGQVVAACLLLATVLDAGSEFFSRARKVTILDAEASQWKVLARNHHTEGVQAQTPQSDVSSSYRNAEVESQVDRILQKLRTLDVQFDAVGVENQSVWICKPSNLSQGRGIQLLTSLDDILALVITQGAGNDGIAEDDDQSSPVSSPPLVPKNKWVVQKYMEQPLLSLQRGRKFDIRQWVLIKSLESLSVFWYHKCYLRFCSEPFQLERAHLDDQFVHLSNFSIQKDAPVATAAAGSGDASEFEAETMWSSDRFQDHLRHEHGRDVWSETIVPQMQHATRIAILSTVSKLKAIGNGFEWLGLDFLLDANHRVWLLEVNVSPDVSHSTSVTAELVPQATEHLLQLVLDEPLASENGWLPLAGFS